MTAPATTRQEYAAAQRNLALQACDRRIEEIVADQVAGRISVDEAIAAYQEAAVDAEQRLAELAGFVAQESPSRRRRVAP